MNKKAIANKIKSLKLHGFGGNCGFAAIEINNQVFYGKGKLVGVCNSFHMDRGSFIGHIFVAYGGYYWDTDARPKTYEDIEDFGVLDLHDPDYYPTDNRESWTEDAAQAVELVEFENELEVIKYMPAGSYCV